MNLAELNIDSSGATHSVGQGGLQALRNKQTMVRYRASVWNARVFSAALLGIRLFTSAATSLAKSFDLQQWRRIRALNRRSGAAAERRKLFVRRMAALCRVAATNGRFVERRRP